MFNINKPLSKNKYLKLFYTESKLTKSGQYKNRSGFTCFESALAVAAFLFITSSVLMIFNCFYDLITMDFTKKITFSDVFNPILSVFFVLSLISILVLIVICFFQENNKALHLQES